MDISRNGVSANITASKKPGAQITNGRPSFQTGAVHAHTGIAQPKPAVDVASGTRSTLQVTTASPQMAVSSGVLSARIERVSPYVRMVNRRAGLRIKNGFPYMQSRKTQIAVSSFFFLLQENGDALLQENGSYINV